MNAKDSIVNIVLCGVGGQGILVASDILSDVALLADKDVKKSEVHGMAQRGGSVISQVRYGKKIYSPLISKGDADYIVAFEKLEALRYIEYLKPKGRIFINDQEIIPLTVFSSDAEYPKNIIEICRQDDAEVFEIDGIKIAEEFGNLRVLNVVMLGVISNFLDFTDEQWLESIKRHVPSKFYKLNEKAFRAGQRWRAETND